jgi:hypothetical protein
VQEESWKTAWSHPSFSEENVQGKQKGRIWNPEEFQKNEPKF